MIPKLKSPMKMIARELFIAFEELDNLKQSLKRSYIKEFRCQEEALQRSSKFPRVTCLSRKYSIRTKTSVVKALTLEAEKGI